MKGRLDLLDGLAQKPMPLEHKKLLDLATKIKTAVENNAYGPGFKGEVQRELNVIGELLLRTDVTR